MLFTLGIDSQFGTLEGVATSLVDMKLFPNLSKEKIIGVNKTNEMSYFLDLKIPPFLVYRFFAVHVAYYPHALHTVPAVIYSN